MYTHTHTHTHFLTSLLIFNFQLLFQNLWERVSEGFVALVSSPRSGREPLYTHQMNVSERARERESERARERESERETERERERARRVGESERAEWVR
jgi:hypothetical protein